MEPKSEKEIRTPLVREWITTQRTVHRNQKAQKGGNRAADGAPVTCSAPFSARKDLLFRRAKNLKGAGAQRRMGKKVVVCEKGLTTTNVQKEEGEFNTKRTGETHRCGLKEN